MTKKIPYDVVSAIENLESELTCGICDNITQDAHTLPCDHSFCKDCITEVLTAGRNECPVCHVPAWNHSVNRSTSLNNFLVALQSLRSALEKDGLVREDVESSGERNDNDTAPVAEDTAMDDSDDSLDGVNSQEIARLEAEREMVRQRFADVEKTLLLAAQDPSQESNNSSSQNNNNSNNNKGNNNSSTAKKLVSRPLSSMPPPPPKPPRSSLGASQEGGGVSVLSPTGLEYGKDEGVKNNYRRRKFVDDDGKNESENEDDDEHGSDEESKRQRTSANKNNSNKKPSDASAKLGVSLGSSGSETQPPPPSLDNDDGGPPIGQLTQHEKQVAHASNTEPVSPTSSSVGSSQLQDDTVIDAMLPPSANRSVNQCPILLPTGLDDQQVKRLHLAEKQLGGILGKSFSMSTTHVVTRVDRENRAVRTLKFAEAVLGGQWIVSIDWVEESLRAGVWVDETPFEVGGDHNAKGGPTKGRLRAQQRKPPLFHNVKLLVVGAQAPLDAAQCTALASLGGATIVRKKPTRPSKDTIAVVDAAKASREEVAELKTLCAAVVRSGWLLDCISNYSLLPPDNHIVQS